MKILRILNSSLASLYTTRSSIHFMPLSTGTYLALLESTVFQLFSIIIEYQLNMCWVVIATLPQVYDIYKRRNHNATMEDVEVMVLMVYGFLSDSTPRFWFLWSHLSPCRASKMAVFVFNLATEWPINDMQSVDLTFSDWNLGPSGTKK